MTDMQSSKTFLVRFEACRKADVEKEELVKEVLSAHQELNLKYERLLGDFDNERDSRRRLQMKCVESDRALEAAQQESERTRIMTACFHRRQLAYNQADIRRTLMLSSSLSSMEMVLLYVNLVDTVLHADKYPQFEDELLKKGAEGGGVAAAMLENDIKETLRSKFPEQPTASWNIITYVFLNADGLAGVLLRCGILDHEAKEQLAEFGHAFGRANPLFNFIDVGNGKERADHKARETLRAFIPLAQCKHIFFGPCNDKGYLPVLEAHSHSITKKKITLIKTRPPAREFEALGLDIRAFDGLFRTSDLPTKPRAFQSNLTSNTALEYRLRGASSEQTAAQRLPDGETTAGSESNRSNHSWSTVANSGIAESSNIKLSTGSGNSAEKLYILLSNNNERLDSNLTPYSSPALVLFEQRRRALGKNFCNNYHLYGSCEMIKCEYIHEPRLSVAEQRILKDKARGIVCYDGSSCRDIHCYKGHQCKFGNSCTDPECRMKMFHHISTVCSFL